MCCGGCAVLVCVWLVCVVGALVAGLFALIRTCAVAVLRVIYVVLCLVRRLPFQAV